VFEDRTYETLLEECLAAAPSGIDTRQGSIFYDACAAKCLKIAELYVDLGLMAQRCRIDTAMGDDLDNVGRDHGVLRNEATPLRCRAVFTGTTPNVGERFFVDGVFFVLKDDLDKLYPDNEELLAGGNLYIEAEIPGKAANVVEEGDRLVPYQNISGLTSALVGEIIVEGADRETDESYRERLRNKVSGPSENGNRHHYKTWCENIPGVGKARIFPLTKIVDGAIVSNVPNWVTGVLLTNDGTPALPATVNLVQEYIDPNMEGLGEGVANLGAHFMAVAASPFYMTIAITDAELAEDYTLEDAKTEIKEILSEYFKELALSDVEDNIITIRIKQVEALIAASNTILDYSALTINDMSKNIEIPSNYVAIVEDVTITEAEDE